MTIQTLENEARNARILAQRLYGQCRKSASSWRALTTSLRSMRNSLEELEDMILDNAFEQGSTTHIFTSIQSCVQVLRDLDRHLQFYRCSAVRWQAEILETVTEVHELLDAATRTLILALEHQSSNFVTAQTENEFDIAGKAVKDQPVPDSTSHEDRLQQWANSNANEDQLCCIPEEEDEADEQNDDHSLGCSEAAVDYGSSGAGTECILLTRHDRASDETSETQTTRGNGSTTNVPGMCEIEFVERIEAHLNNDDSNTTIQAASVDRSKTEPSASALYVDPANTALPPSPLMGSVEDLSLESSHDIPAMPQDSQRTLIVPTFVYHTTATPVLDWRSPFAEVDPLSVDFEAATSFLLGTPRNSIASGLSDGVSVSPIELHTGSSASDADKQNIAIHAHEIMMCLDAIDASTNPSDADMEVLKSAQSEDEAQHQLIKEDCECDDSHDSETEATEAIFVDCVSCTDIDEQDERQLPIRAESMPSEDSDADQASLGSSAADTDVLPSTINVALPKGEYTAEGARKEIYVDGIVGARTASDSEISTPPSAPISSDTVQGLLDGGAGSQNDIELQPLQTDTEVDLSLSPSSSANARLQVNIKSHDMSAKMVDSEVNVEGTRYHSDLRRVSEDSVCPISPLILMPDPIRRASDTSLAALQVREQRTRALSEPSIVGIDVMAALKHVMGPPPPPPKGRYHIVNPSQNSWSSCEERLDLPSRDVSPISSMLSTEIPVIIIDGSLATETPTNDSAHGSSYTSPVEQSSAAYDSRPGDTGLSTKFGASRTIINAAECKPAEQVLAKRYYRQDLVSDVVSPPEAKNHTKQSAANSSNPLPKEQQIEQPIVEYYGACGSEFDILGLNNDTIRTNSICQSWNRKEWNRAEAYLLDLLEARLQQDDIQSIRRARHLLGVSASFQGQWQRAIKYFLSALNSPLTHVSIMDDGDFAALTWLADCYVLCNRRLEAFIANALAVHYLALQDVQPSLLYVLSAEQKAILLGGSSTHLELRWAQLISSQSSRTKDTILDPCLVSTDLIEHCFRQPSVCPSALRLPSTTAAQNRGRVLCQLEKHSRVLTEYMDIKIDQESFDFGMRWPVPYDPFFTMEQAAKGRLCDAPCDLLTTFRASPSFNIPKNGPLGAARFDCFTCGDLHWLVVAIRECLTSLEMMWDEVANNESVWFLARFTKKHRKILTTNYFAVSLFKQSMRQGYGVEVCVAGVKSARIIEDSPEFPIGVHSSCEKRLKKFFKDYLTRSYRLWVRSGKPPSDLVMNQVALGSLVKDASNLVSKELPALPSAAISLYA